MASLYLPQITNTDILNNKKQRWLTICADYVIWELQTVLLGNPFVPVWTERKFEKTSQSSIPDAMGVYMFVIKSTPETLTNNQHRYILYVGQAVNLRKRFGEYFHYAHSNKPSDQLKRVMTLIWKDRLNFHYFETPNFTIPELTSIEFDLIDRIVPPMNNRFRADILKQYVKLYSAR